MPAEKFYPIDHGQGEGPAVIVEWHRDAHPIEVVVNGSPLDRSGLNRLIRTLRKARDQTYGADA